MDLSEVFPRSAPEFAKPLMQEGAVWGPFIVEIPGGSVSLGSSLFLDAETNSISWIDTNDMGRGIGIEGEPEIGEDGNSIIVKNRDGDEYIFRSVLESDWEAFGFDSPVSQEEVAEEADSFFAPFELEDDEEE